tara:strand:+ start:29574 stop:30041 length:468 start_codon:yes stop_codon:yes gene_type:complete
MARERGAWCEGPFAGRAEQVLSAHGVSKTFTYFPEGEFEDQIARYPSKLCPLAALGDAIEAILLDDAEEALASVARERGVADCDSICLLDRSSSMIGIVADDHSRIENRLLPTAPTQHSLKAHWVFFVSVPDLSEHGYWALVARDGSGVTVVRVN